MICFNKRFFNATESFSQRSKTRINHLLLDFNNKTRKEKTKMLSLFLIVIVFYL